MFPQMISRLPFLCNTYKQQLQYAHRENQYIANYLTIIPSVCKTFGRKPIVDLSDYKNYSVSKDGWLMTLAKLDPDKFIQGNVTYQWLGEMHDKQMKFHDKVTRINLNNTDKMLVDYLNFLYVYGENRQNVVVPTLQQDFVWHAHMIDHDLYVADMKQLFGKVLGHDTDIAKQNQSSCSTAPIIMSSCGSSSSHISNDGSDCSTSDSNGSSCSSSSCGSSGCGGGGD